ncbi:MAG: Integration host factor subunit alpha [Wolbachia endosymbiont of Ctenocephalides orientis wCori]|nr:MAG: Integration host factor subunit alpha [Wolbachia endosymbiont of Ctenocephalides orientis wCori]
MKDSSAIKQITLTKEEIAKNINQEIGLSKEDSVMLVNDIVDAVKESLLEEGKVKIPSLGTFLIKEKKERLGNIPSISKKILKKVIVSARKVICFRPSPKLKKLINNNKSNA